MTGDNASEFVKRSVSFLVFFGILSLMYYMVEGLETLGVLLLIVTGSTLVLSIRSLVFLDHRIDYVLTSQIGMIAALSIILCSVTVLGGVINSAFVAFLTTPPIFFYFGAKAMGEPGPHRARKIAGAFGLLLYGITTLMFHFDRVGLPFSNPLLNNFTWDDANAIVSSGDYYKTQISIFVLSILIFVWNLPEVMGRVSFQAIVGGVDAAPRPPPSEASGA